MPSFKKSLIVEQFQGNYLKFDLVDQLNWTLFKMMRSVRYHFTPTAATYKAVGLETGRPKVNSNFIQFFPLSVLLDLNVKLMRRA